MSNKNEEETDFVEITPALESTIKSTTQAIAETTSRIDRLEKKFNAVISFVSLACSLALSVFFGRKHVLKRAAAIAKKK